MPWPSPAVTVVLSTRQRKILKKLRRQRTLPQCLVWRINIVLRAAKGQVIADLPLGWVLTEMKQA